jgi:2,3-bisphosphoglycerate-dependent phosphoglycerate mutase
MSHLILVRHGKSEWNALGIWTGLNDINLNDEGRAEARRAGEALRDVKIDKAYTSALKRAQQTLDEIKSVLGLENLPTVQSAAINERDYGDLAKKNKWKIKEEYGEEQFNKWRRGWDEKIPHGETLKDVYNRAVPYFKETILPDLLAGKNVIITAHGNSLRALVKYLENIPEADIAKLEIGTGEIYLYEIDKEGKVVSKEVRAANEMKGKV